jgi:hypothetical protein
MIHPELEMVPSNFEQSTFSFRKIIEGSVEWCWVSETRIEESWDLVGQQGIESVKLDRLLLVTEVTGPFGNGVAIVP